MTRPKPGKTLGMVLRSWRESAGISQREAAARAQVNQATWSRWESDRMMPGADDLLAILGAASGDLTASGLVRAAAEVRLAS